jgi:hypothetical protein
VSLPVTTVPETPSPFWFSVNDIGTRLPFVSIVAAQFPETSAATNELIAATAISTNRRIIAGPPREIVPHLETELKFAAKQSLLTGIGQT